VAIKIVAIICGIFWVLWPVLSFTPALDHVPLLPAAIIGIACVAIAIVSAIALAIMALIDYARRPR